MIMDPWRRYKSISRISENRSSFSLNPISSGFHPHILPSNLQPCRLTQQIDFPNPALLKCCFRLEYPSCIALSSETDTDWMLRYIVVNVLFDKPACTPVPFSLPCYLNFSTVNGTCLPQPGTLERPSACSPYID